MNRMVLMASAVRGAIALAVMAALMLFAACGGGGRQLTPADLTLVGASPPTTTGPPAASATPPGKLPESAGLGGGVGGGGDNGGAGPPPPIDGNPEVRPGPPQGDYWLRETADPFTTEYEWEDGTILAGNVTPEELQGFINEGVDYFDRQVPDIEVWIDPATGQPREVIAGEVRAYFGESAGEQELRDMFGANSFEVAFSWFEPGQAPETNEMASFQLAFDREEHPTLDDAMDFLESLPYTVDASPNFYYEVEPCYAPPLDLWSQPRDGGAYPHGDRTWYQYSLHVWTFDPNRYSIVPIYSLAYTRTKIAVIDTGVKRDHEDLQGVFTEWGVDCFNRCYIVGRNNGWYRWFDPHYEHGTAVSGIIGALTNNPPIYPGVASCSPGIKVLPVYVHLVGNSVEKAIRALRFEFPLTGGKPKETDVRVVNMSLCGLSGQKVAEKDIDRDILVEKRFYVASAGNDGTCGLYYPAAYDKVMGVTGMMGELRAQNMQETLSQHPQTNYYNTQKYPASAFYDYRFYPSPGAGFPPTLPSLVTTQIAYHYPFGYGYGRFGGTSAAAPQVAALAARLFEQRFLLPTEGNRMLVWNRIVSTLRDPRGSIGGIVDYETALEGW